MNATPTTANATEQERELAAAVDDARATLEATRDAYAKAADHWCEAVRERQRRHRYTYTPAQAEARKRAQENERQAYDALHAAAQDTDQAERLRNEAIAAHERHAYPPDDRTRPTYAPSYRTRATILTAHDPRPSE